MRPSIPSSSIRPRVFGSGRRASRCQSAAVAALAAPTLTAPARRPAFATPLLEIIQSSIQQLAGWPGPAYRAARSRRTRALEAGAPIASPPEVGGEPAFRCKLLQVGLHHLPGRRDELLRDVVPDLGEEGVAGALTAVQCGDQAALAHLTVLDVLGELCC